VTVILFTRKTLRLALQTVQTQSSIQLGTGVVFVSAVILCVMGQPVWCSCGSWQPWSWDIWSLHNSQHLIDPYTFTHVLHGFVLCGVLYWLPQSFTERVRLLLAVVLESSWEILENCPFIIERYRAATISKDYFGDSVTNSTGDIIACMLGYLLARRLGLRYSAVLFLLTELILLLTIRDSLVLNVLMLIWPFEAVKLWQMGSG
jgi:hypothetical protein